MYIYLMMLAISLLFCYLAEDVKNKKIKIILKILSAVPFFIISAIRYDVGTDYFYRYVPNFNSIAMGNDVVNLEMLFKIIIKISLLFSTDYQYFFVIMSAMMIFAIFFVIYKYSKEPLISIFIFFGGCFFFQSLNITRQLIAASVAVIFYQLLIEKKYKYVIPTMVLAFLIHETSIVMLIGIFLTKKVIANPIVLIILMILISSFSGILNDFVDVIISETKFSYYTDSKFDRGEVNEEEIVVNISIYLLCYYILFRSKLKNRTSILYINLLGLAVIVTWLGNVYFLFNRLSYYFSIIQVIAIPYFIYVSNSEIKENIFTILLNKLNNNKNIQKELKNTENNKIQNPSEKGILIIAFIIILLANNIYNTNVLRNDNEVVPYKTVFWDRKE